MKILITGALGYIGSETLLRLSARPDITVYAVDNDPVALQDRSSVFFRYPNIKIINCDITDEHQVKLLPESDMIVHLAAAVGYLGCNNNPDNTFRVNVTGTENICKLGIPTIFFSTGSVYGEIGQVCNESVEPNPKTVYATTKYKAEQYIQQVSHVIFRPATAFGLGLKVRHDLLIHDMAHQVAQGKHIDLYQPYAMRSFYSVQKLSELIEYTCDNFEKFQNQIFNVGCDSGNMKKEDILKHFGAITTVNYTIVQGEDADKRDYNVDYSRLKSVWSDFNEDTISLLPNIMEYYKQWSTQ
jgi:UDP-glucose 4-epimerase